MARFDPDKLPVGSGLAVRARTILDGALSGLHRARLHGSSVEFSTHKEYSPGDEIRHIDWKTYARNDRYYIKQFENETELTAYLVLDASASMTYAGNGPSKLDVAAELLAALAYLFIGQRDKAGLLVFGSEQRDGYLPPRSRPAHLHDLLTILEQVVATGARGEEPPSAALERIAELTRRRKSLIVIASDFFDPSGRAATVLQHLRAQGHDVIAFHVLAEDELRLPFDGLTEFVALEGSRTLLVHPGSIRRRYQDRLRAFLDRFEAQCIDAAVDYEITPTSQPVEQTLLRFLSHRASPPPHLPPQGGGRVGDEDARWVF
jgi:uncharacterized protein (DUF58 family)